LADQFGDACGTGQGLVGFPYLFEPLAQTLERQTLLASAHKLP
jgi:hypothetical protein